jgi:hypothetical protein
MWVLLRPPRLGGAKTCRRSRRSVSTSRSRFFKSTELTWQVMKKLLLAGIAVSMVYTMAARAADDDPPTTIAFPALAAGLAVQRHPRHRDCTRPLQHRVRP